MTEEDEANRRSNKVNRDIGNRSQHHLTIHPILLSASTPRGLLPVSYAIKAWKTHSRRCGIWTNNINIYDYMRIHHIAVYVRDMAVVSEFIEKYFEANQS